MGSLGRCTVVEAGANSSLSVGGRGSGFPLSSAVLGAGLRDEGRTLNSCCGIQRREPRTDCLRSMTKSLCPALRDRMTRAFTRYVGQADSRSDCGWSRTREIPHKVRDRLE